MTNVIGIDIGLRNLAICIIQTDTGDIKLWNNYSVLPEMERCYCGKPGKYSYLTEQLCGIHSRKFKDREIVKKVLVKDLDLQEIVILIINKLRSIMDDYTEIFGNVVQVVIERQPRFNPKMCFVSHIIFCLFCDYYNKIGNPCIVKMEHAGIKLIKYKKQKGKISYKTRKEMAIQTTEGLICNSEYVDFFGNTDKKDDMADCFLLANNQRL